MSYCAYCGNKIDDSAIFCPNCGAKNEAREDKKYNEERYGRDEYSDLSHTFAYGRTNTAAPSPDAMNGNALITVLAFIFPIVGFILWYTWKLSKPGWSSSALTGALVSVSVGTPFIGLIIFLINKDKNKALANACGIAAIVGVVFVIVVELCILTFFPELEKYFADLCTGLLFSI